MLSPRLATCVYAAFILWLLYRDSKHSENSLALWIPTLWVGILASKPVLYWFQGNAGGAIDVENFIDGDPIDRNILMALLCLGILTLARRRVDFVTTISRNKALLIFYVYLAFSILWSDYPFVAFKRYIRDLGNIFMILVILTESRPVEAVRRVLLRCAYVLIPLSVLFIKYYPEIGRYYSRWTWTTMYAGATAGKNQLGLLTMVSGIVLVWTVFQGPRVNKSRIDLAGDGIVLLMCLWMLNIADSATSLTCFVVGAVTLFLCRMRWIKSNASRLTWGLYAALALSALVLWSPASRGLVAGSVGRDPTLTTRTEIWAAVLTLKTNFLFGAGYNSVWLSDAGRKLGKALEVPHAHNGYLEAYLNTGIVGLSLLLAVLLSAGRNAARQLSEGSFAGSLLVALFLSGMLYNYTEVTFNTGSIVYIGLLLAAVRYSPFSSVQAAERGTSAASSRLKGVGPIWSSRPVPQLTR
jgi:exopolysaccharide production protein ExoQ